jgi:hypothetical protein
MPTVLWVIIDAQVVVDTPPISCKTCYFNWMKPLRVNSYRPVTN